MIDRFDFGVALIHLKNGRRVCRAGWNGKRMFLFHISTWTFTAFDHDSYRRLPFIAMKTADDCIVPWLASQTDILATDWELAT